MRMHIYIYIYLYICYTPHVPTFGVLRWCLKPFSWHSIGYALSPIYDISCMPFIYPMKYSRIPYSIFYTIPHRIPYIEGLGFAAFLRIPGLHFIYPIE